MTLPIRSLYHPFIPQLITLICLLAAPLTVFAETKPVWDCQRDSVSGEWSCVAERAKDVPVITKKKKHDTSEQPVPQSISKPVEATVIIPEEPSKPAPAKIVKPLIPKQPGWECKASQGGKGWDCTLNGADTKTAQTEKKPSPEKRQLAGKAVPDPTKKEPMPGWACTPDEEEQGWDCKLTGLDPKGKMHLPRPIEATSATGTDRVNYQEFVFQNMLDVIPQDPWGNCSAVLGQPVIYRSETTRNLRQQSAATIESDFSEAFENDQVVTFSGNTDFKRADQTLRADSLTHDQLANTISARGNVLYHEEGMTFHSNKSFFWLDSNQGKLHDSYFIFETVPARGSSRLTSIESKTLTHHRDITYTTCRPGNQDWELEANKLTLDQGEGVGTARNVWLHFKGVPIFYAPWITFPIDSRRKSGFLMPSFGSGDETGFDLAIPYYLNIAPNYDATITPRYLSRRGFLLGAEFRYLTSDTEGAIAAEYIAKDKQTEDTRGQITLENKTRFSKNLSSSIDINLVSDDDYLDDFGNSLSLNDSSHLLNRADMNYRGSGWSLLGRLDGYQTIDHDVSSADQPYRRLPQILFNMDKQEGPAGSQLNFQTEFVYFDKGGRVTGKRLDIRPEISFPMRTAASFLTPKLALQSTQYWLDDQTSGEPSHINRTLPILSVDGGLFFERDLAFSERNWKQTLEPRLFYLFTPNKNQDDIPIFDTGEYDFGLSQLFRTNRFSGRDRINDANQLTAALTTRFIESETGRERLRASIGQIFYFRDRKVTLPGETTLTDNRSDLVTELDAILTEHWSFRTGYQWDPHQGDSKKASASLRYRDGTSRLFNLSYQFREDNLEQTDASLRWPLSDTWHGVARWNYSLRDEITLDSFIGLEKESCCWRFKFVIRHSVDDIASEPETAFFFQLELKGLTSFGKKLDKMLFDEIPGYQLPDSSL